jgi:hypothetical protein
MIRIQELGMPNLTPYGLDECLPFLQFVAYPLLHLVAERLVVEAHAALSATKRAERKPGPSTLESLWA